MAETMEFKIEVLDSQRHDRSNFCCGQETLDRYIKQQASQDLKKRIAATHILIKQPENVVLAYYSLSSYTIQIENLEIAFAKGLPKYPQLPATLLGRLAVDQGQQGQGLGDLMLMDALRRSLEISRQIASLAVVVDALDQGAVTFYLKYGFRQSQGEAMKLYLPMKSIEMLFE
jgi:predicted GNAT family N-acyltransferase